ncbi:MAG: ATP-binding cassette domain-containing protein, partial [Bacteroidetes bacterium]|nr:ATP-binding cassette domain-containing protein [Bacteroidota bacterium]
LLLILFLLFYYTGKKGLATSLQESKFKYRIAHWLEELARNLTTFKIAGNTRLPLNKLENYLSGYLYKRRAHFKVLIWQYSSFVIFKTVIVGGLLIMGGFLVIDRQISVGQFVAAEIVIVTIMAAIEKLLLRLDIIYDILTAVEKIGNVTDLEIETEQGLVTQNVHSGFHLKIQNLSFTYPNAKEKALADISFEIEAGKSIAIVGAEGSGKSTLMHLLAGMYHNYQGQIEINSFSLKDLNISAYRDQIGDSLSHEHIFEGSLLENLSLGRNSVSQADVQKYLEVTELNKLVNELPNGLHTQLVATGQGLPSSARKRIVLTRSLLGNPKLILFDDFFFNLESAYKIRVLNKILQDKVVSATIIASSHDPLVLERVDTIIMLEKGKLVAKGSWSELKNIDGFQCLIDCR